MTTTTNTTRIDNVLNRQRSSLVKDRLLLLGVTALTLMNFIALF